MPLPERGGGEADLIMAGSPFERTERLLRLMGEAFVTWSEIETLWRRMLPFLLFRDFKHPRDEAGREIGGRADDELSTAEERAYAMWDALNNSAAQLDLVLKLAPRVLTDLDQETGLAQLLSVGKATHDKRSKRNALAHSGFERTMRVEGGTDYRHIILGQQIMRPALHAHSAIRGQDLEVVIPEILGDFRQHREDVRNVWSWLRIGLPKDAGAPSPDTRQQRSKAGEPNRRERGQQEGAKKRQPRPGSS
jgi:hypothetical protein